MLYFKKKMKKTSQKYTAREIKSLITEEIQQQIRINKLLEAKKKITNDLNVLLEEFRTSNNNVFYQEPEVKKGGKNETIFHTKPGNVISLSFQDIKGLKLRRQKRSTPGMIDNDLMWKVEDAANSTRLKKGDYLEIEGNDNLEQGNTFVFSIYRPTENGDSLKPIGIKYETSPLTSWLNNA